MSFETLMKKELYLSGANAKRYVHNFKDRDHVSRVKIDAYSNARYLKVGEYHIGRYENEVSMRYVAATQMSYDTLISVYNVNTRDMLVFRVFKLDAAALGLMGKFVDKQMRLRPNFEVRIIGMQNNEDHLHIYPLIDYLVLKKLPVVEVDLFGSETRHITMDMKLGMGFNVLMENRLYRPGELVNNATMEQFEKEIKK